MKDVKSHRIQILKWTFIGLFLRIILMPFTMHGMDLVFIHYFPILFINQGIWNPYGFISTNLSYFRTAYYGPVLFLIFSITDFIVVKLFNAASLVKILELSITIMAKQGAATVDYVHAFYNLDLFKNLFLMKSPYLVFDFLIAMLLLKLALSKDSALKSYKLWMLNVVVLHSAYAVGQCDLIPAFFVIAALYAAIKKKPYLCITLLSLGGATKLWPYILILPACLLLGHNWKKRTLLMFTAGIVTLLLYLPFYLSCRNAIFGVFLLSNNVQYSGIERWVLLGIFIILYSLISIKSIKDSRTPSAEHKLIYYFIVLIFLLYTTFPTRFRYFVLITPLLALIIPGHRKFGIFILLVILMLAFSWLTERDLQLGLFMPLNPALFSNLPTLQEVIGRFVNIEILYRISCRALLLSFFAAAWWVWQFREGHSQQ